MNIEEIKEKIKTIFIGQFPNEGFRWDKKQEGFPQWDSLAHMELAGKVEEVFGIRFEIDDIMGLNSPEDFVNCVSKKIKK